MSRAAAGELADATLAVMPVKASCGKLLFRDAYVTRPVGETR
jgi:hypothetical protein